VLLIILNINIRTVQADTYYKQGLAYESTGGWESAVTLYREAARLEPAEDFYYLFLGRALLSYANGSRSAGIRSYRPTSTTPTRVSYLSFLDQDCEPITARRVARNQSGTLGCAALQPA
jgi:tetratricopeptide (TPR) repeat protein